MADEVIPPQADVTSPPPRTEVAPAPETPPAPVPEAPPVSRQLAATAIKERELREKEVGIKRAEAAVRQTAARLEAQQKELTARLDGAKNDPLAFLNQIGVPPHELAARLLGQKEIKPEDAIKSELEKIKAQLQTSQQQQAAFLEQQKEQQRQAQIQTFAEKTLTFVTNNADRWKYIVAFDAQAAVAQAVLDNYNRVGTIMKVEEAADELESKLKAQYEKAAKLQSAPSLQPSKPAGDAKPGTKNLTNTATPAPGSTNRPKLSEEERLKRAYDAVTFD